MANLALISVIGMLRPEGPGDLLEVTALGGTRLDSVSPSLPVPDCLGGHSRSFPLRVFSSYPALGLALEGGGRGTGGRSCEKRGAEHGGQFTVEEAVEVCVETRLKKEVLFLVRL